MTRRSLERLLGLLLLLPASAAAGEARFMTQPDVRGERIVFAYEGDLYLAGVEGGTPVRLTSHPAGELAPKFSPDGRWIAYSTFRSGVLDVWLMPAEGGTPKRLTWPPLGGQVVGWTPDSRRVVFRSAFGTPPVSRDQRLYTVSLDATLPEALPPDRGMSASFSPDGSKLLYVRRGDESYYWKRYKGGRYPDVWLYDFGAKSFKPVTDYVGRNGFPMWIAPATMLFTSDRGSDGITNLWAQDLAGGPARQVTAFTDFDVMTPSSDGRRVVFVQNGYLWLMDAGGGAPHRLTLRIPSDDWRLEDRFINPSEQLESVDIGNDGRTIVLGARGDAFTVTLAEKEKDKEASPRNLTRTPGVREEYPRLSPDGSRVAYFADTTGEYQLYVRDLKSGEETRLTSDLDRKVYHPCWSPDGKKLLFGDKDFALWVVEVATKKRTKLDEWHRLDNDEFTWEVSDYAWSPDSRWVAYSATAENRNNVIALYDTLEGRKVAVSDDFYDSFNPRFDADGGYLYFLSHRNFEIAMDPFEDDHIVARPTRVMAVALRRGERPPFAHPPADEPSAPAAVKPGDVKPGDVKPGDVKPAGRRRRWTPRASGSTRRASPRACTRCRSSPATTSTCSRASATSRGRRSRRSRRRSSTNRTARRAARSGRCTSSRSPTRRRWPSTTRSRRPRSLRTASSSSCARTRPCTRRRSRRRTRRRSSGARSTSPASSTACPRARSGARSSPTPGAGTATSSTTRTCTAATGRRSGRSTGRTSRRSAPASSSTGCSPRWSASCASRTPT